VIFQLNNRTLAYGTNTVLGDVSLTINSGERVALVGPSGAGKTTLLRALYEQCPEQVALSPQRYGLVDTLSVYHNIYMGQLDRHSALYNAWNLLRPIARHRQAIYQLADELGLADKLDYSVDGLSGGQRQRVAIGRALYRQQATFFGDEPVSSLDSLQAKTILELVLSRHQTAVVALHNRQLALSLFDRIIGISDGEIQFDLAVTELEPQQLDALYSRDGSDSHPLISTHDGKHEK
jgi:phosphonate transport system ATP-binding protein